jgi:hypothetical protein
MTKRPVQAAHETSPKSKTETCPVAAAALEVKILTEREEQIEIASMSLTGGARCENDRLNERLYDRRKFVQEQASHLQAKSGLGALFQVIMIHEAAHDIFDNMERKGSEYGQAAKAFKRIDRMAYSLLTFIEASTGTKPDEAGAELYMPEDLNPHLQLAKALSGTKEG